MHEFLVEVKSAGELYDSLKKRQLGLSQSIGTDKDDKHKVDDLYRDIVRDKDSYRAL